MPKGYKGRAMCACGRDLIHARGVCQLCYLAAYRVRRGHKVQAEVDAKPKTRSPMECAEELTAAESDIRRYRENRDRVVGYSQRIYWRKQIGIAQGKIDVLKKELEANDIAAAV